MSLTNQTLAREVGNRIMHSFAEASGGPILETAGLRCCQKSKYGMRPWSIWFSDLQSSTPDRRVYYEPRLLKITRGIEIDHGVYDAAIERDPYPIESRFIFGLEVWCLVFSFIIWSFALFPLSQSDLILDV